MVIVMTDAASLLSASVLRNLADKLYEKRKNAALEASYSIRCLSSFQRKLKGLLRNLRFSTLILELKCLLKNLSLIKHAFFY